MHQIWEVERMAAQYGVSCGGYDMKSPAVFVEPYDNQIALAFITNFVQMGFDEHFGILSVGDGYLIWEKETP